MLDAPSPRLPFDHPTCRPSQVVAERNRQERQSEAPDEPAPAVRLNSLLEEWGEGMPAPPADAPTPDGPVWRDGAFRRDAWVRAPESGDLPDRPVIVSKARWLAERETLMGSNAPLGLTLEGGAALDDIAADLGRFALVAVNFPKFSDGRAFSTARLLREKLAFAGELRAAGNVLADQIPLMRRVGFDAFEVTHAPTRRALAEGRIAEVSLHYQPAWADEPPAGTRPWLRKTVR
jgi:phosphoadenosine phosphosulfate reductase